MRLFRIAFAVFYDPFWFGSFRLSWKRRRFWLAIPSTHVLTGRMLAAQVGPLTFKLHVHGPDKGDPDHG